MKAISYATLSIVSTKEKGAAFTIDIPAEVEVNLLEKGDKNIVINATLELKKLAEKTLKFFNYPNYSLNVKIKDEKIPAEGFGRREAIALALTFAISGALAKKHGSLNELKIDKFLRKKFLILDGKVLDDREMMNLCFDNLKNLKFERLAASFYGGFAVTDNEKNEVLRRGEIEEDIFLLYKKIKNKKMTTVTTEKNVESELNLSFNETLKGNLYSAMKMNSLIFASEETRKILKLGAFTASFSFPYLVGLFREKNIKESKKIKFQNLKTKITNKGVEILGEPRRVYKVNDFLKLRGAKTIF